MTLIIWRKSIESDLHVVHNPELAGRWYPVGGGPGPAEDLVALAKGNDEEHEYQALPQGEDPNR